MASPYPSSPPLLPRLPPRAHRPTRPRSSAPSLLATTAAAAVLFLTLAVPAAALRVPFQNCLPDSYRLATPTPLQWVPLAAEAFFDTEAESHNLRFTVWGNVTGSFSPDPLPPPDSPHWSDNNATEGKIVRNSGPLATTLISDVKVVTYRPYNLATDFCTTSLANGRCPLGPVFDTSNVDFPYGLPSINLTNDFYSTYAFTSFSATFILTWGDLAATNIGCVSAPLTPDLGNVAWMLRALPFAVLILVALSTIFAAIFSACGTSDVYYWSSNFGRQTDLIRLVTPGFGDCLQYIQFVALTGALSLDYPGFYQPVASRTAWSALMFGGSLVSRQPSWQGVVDGLYHTNGTTGMQRMAQLVGIPEPADVWAGTMVWTLVIVAAVTAFFQSGFLLKRLYRHFKNTPEEDLRSKNIPFSLGNVVRIVMNYFLLPIVALSTFQLVVAADSPAYVVALAVVTLLLIVGFAIRLLWLIVSTKPRVNLYDDLQTLLAYGPLYNTYSEEAAPFVLVPLLLTFTRGIAIGAVQPSGVAQLVLLAICEVIQALTLHAFRPFHSPTSMNAYHTVFCVVRFIVILLMIAFVPSLGVTEGPKGWIGYAVLLLHGSVLIFGFFINALQKIVEVTAYLLGVGADGIVGGGGGGGGSGGGHSRTGGVGGLSRILGARQLRRRMSRRRHAGPSRQSYLSSTAILDAADDAGKGGVGYAMAGGGDGRVRSGSAASLGGLLHHSRHRSSTALDTLSLDLYSPIAPTSTNPLTPGATSVASTFSFLPPPAGRTASGAAGTAAAVAATAPLESSDPYYRPPRPRQDSGGDPHGSSPQRDSAAVPARRYSQTGAPAELGEPEGQLTRAGSRYAHGSIQFAPRTDYSTREVDFYYGVRGPALKSDGRTGRRLGTGPADPTGPMASAASWFRGLLFGGKSKEKGKGFEVVRSSRMPPAMKAAGGDLFSDEAPPEGIPVTMAALRKGPIDSDDDEEPGAQKSPLPPPKQGRQGRLIELDLDGREDRNGIGTGTGNENENESGGGLGSPRVNKKEQMRTAHSAPEGPGDGSGSTSASKNGDNDEDNDDDNEEPATPDIPRKSSRRLSAALDQLSGPSRGVRPSSSSQQPEHAGQPSSSSHLRPRSALNGNSTDSSTSRRLPFERTGSHAKRLSSNESMDGLEVAELVAREHGRARERQRQQELERPTSFGYVKRHSASFVEVDDNGRVGLGREAELVDEDRGAK